MGQLEFHFARDAERHFRRRVVQYALALVLVAACLVPLFLGAVPHAFAMSCLVFFPAIIFSAAFLSRGPVLVAIASSLGLAFWLGNGGDHFGPGQLPTDWFSGPLFALTGVALLYFSERTRFAVRKQKAFATRLDAKTLELSSSEEFNRRMLASMPDCVNMLGLDGSLLSINEAGKRLFEIEEINAWLKRNWVDQWPEEFRDGARQALHQARSGCVTRMVAPCATAKGRQRWWEVVLSPVHDRKGCPERLLVISRDITERHESETRRIESEERRRLVIAATDDAIWDLDVSNDRFTVNESYQRIYGRPVDEHWRQWLVGRIHPEDEKRVNGAFNAALRGTTLHWTCEYRFQREDGQWGHVLDRAYIARDHNGSPRRVVGAMMNLLPLRKAEWRAELLAETSALLLRADSPQKVVNDLCEKVMRFLQCDAFFNFLIDESSGLLRLNASGGLSAKQVELGKIIDPGTVCGCVARQGESIVAENIQNSADPRVELVRSLGIQAYACHPLLVRGKTVGTLSFGSASRERFESEELALMKAVADQVAIAMERQKTEDDLRKMNEELERRVDQRTESLAKTTEQLNSFCYSIAHDLRAPLRTQTGFARLLLDDYAKHLDETGRHYLKAIMQAAERQSNIIQDLMAHVNVSRADLAMEHVELATAIRQAEADLQVELQQNCATILVNDIDGEVVLANRSSLHLVLLNLLSNACKFVPKGTQPVVKIRTEKRKDYCRLWVEDNGIGIAPEDQSRLFGMFQRLKKGDYPGTGMGLAIVKTAIERMGGDVGIESEPGKGSRFWIELKKVPRPEKLEPRERGMVQLVS